MPSTWPAGATTQVVVLPWLRCRSARRGCSLWLPLTTGPRGTRRTPRPRPYGPPSSAPARRAQPTSRGRPSRSARRSAQLAADWSSRHGPPTMDAALAALRFFHTQRMVRRGLGGGGRGAQRAGARACMDPCGVGLDEQPNSTHTALYRARHHTPSAPFFPSLALSALRPLRRRRHAHRGPLPERRSAPAPRVRAGVERAWGGRGVLASQRLPPPPPPVAAPAPAPAPPAVRTCCMFCVP
jgi:hypothetical protein